MGFLAPVSWTPPGGSSGSSGSSGVVVGPSLPGATSSGVSSSYAYGYSAAASGGLKYLPGVSWTPPTADRDTLNSTATDPNETQLTVAAQNQPVPIIYGLARVGPKIAYVLPYNGQLVILAIWCHGEIDSIQQLWLDDKTFTGITEERHLGTSTQSVSSVMASAVGGTYTDTLDGVAYSVFTAPVGSSQGFPRINALVKGLKVYDPRDGTQTLGNHSTYKWSDNPALCLADFISNTTYGMGYGDAAIDWTSVTTIANLNDATSVTGSSVVAIGEKHRTLNLSMEQPQTCEAWVDTLRTYAGCWVVSSNGLIKFVRDGVGSSVATYDFDSSSNFLGISNITKRGILNNPNVMILSYTDTLSIPYKNGSVTVDTSSVGNRKESTINLPGINRYTQAYREAVERLNKLTLCDLSFDIDIADQGLEIEIGDIVGVKHPMGISDGVGNPKLMRVLGITAPSTGRYKLSLTEYDPAVYQTTVVSTPTWADTVFPSPNEPPTPTGLVLTEEVYEVEIGTWSTRIRATWNASTWTYVGLKYSVVIKESGVIVGSSGLIADTTWASPPVKENVTYSVEVLSVTSQGVNSDPAIDSIIAYGKYLVPGNVPSITGFEAGGDVYLSWQPAVDKDIWKYELRYSTTGQTWDYALLLDRLDGLRATISTIPVGTWRIHVKAIDSVGQYSTTAAVVDITVTSDASAFLVDTKYQTNPTLVNMVAYTLSRTDPNVYYSSDSGTVVNTMLSGSLSAYTNPLATYHPSMTSTWTGEEEDFGQLLGGQWTGTATVEDITGSHTSYMGFSATSTASPSYVSGLSQVQNARFCRLKHEALTTSTLKVTIPNQYIRLDAIPRDEVGIQTTTGVGAYTVTLTNSYVSCKKLTITPIGTTARTATYDNIVTGTPTKFDVYIFNDSGSLIASDFRFDWQGV